MFVIIGLKLQRARIISCSILYVAMIGYSFPHFSNSDRSLINIYYIYIIILSTYVGDNEICTNDRLIGFV